MTAPLTRQQRRALERQSDRLLARTAWTQLPDDLDCDAHVGLLHGGAPLLVASRDAVRLALGKLGFSEVLDDLQQRPRPAGKLPVIVVVADDAGPVATVAFVPVVRMTPGAA